MVNPKREIPSVYFIVVNTKREIVCLFYRGQYKHETLSFSPHLPSLTERRNRKACQLTYRGLFSSVTRFSSPRPQWNSKPVAVNDRSVVAETWETELPLPFTCKKSEEPADTVKEHSPGHLYSSTSSPGISSVSEQRWTSQCSRRHKDEPYSRTQNSTDTFTAQFVRKEILLSEWLAVCITLEVLQLRIHNLVNLLTG